MMATRVEPRIYVPCITSNSSARDFFISYFNPRTKVRKARLSYKIANRQDRRKDGKGTIFRSLSSLTGTYSC